MLNVLHRTLTFLGAGEFPKRVWLWMNALHCFQSCRFDSGLVDSGEEAWQGRLGLRDQTLPLKKSCVCGEEGGGRRYMCVCTCEENPGRERSVCKGMC